MIITMLSDLRAQAGTTGAAVEVLGKATTNDGYGDLFYWDAADSTTPDNGVTVLAVTGVSVGRWKRLKTLNVRTGSYTTSAVTLITNYVVPHDLGVVPSLVIITPTSANAAALSYVSAKTATSFTINFLAVPLVGTNNISFDWLVRA